MVSYDENAKREIDYFLPWLADWLGFICLLIWEYKIIIGTYIFAGIVLINLYGQFGIYAYLILFGILLLGVKAQQGNHCMRY